MAEINSTQVRVRKRERVQGGREIPWPWPASGRTGGVLSSPWKVWLSHGFSEPGKFPQRRSTAPLSARNAGRQRNAAPVMSDTTPAERGGGGLKKLLFNVCYKYFRETVWRDAHRNTTGQRGPKWSRQLGAPEWKEGQLSMCLFWQGGSGVRATERERWERVRRKYFRLGHSCTSKNKAPAAQTVSKERPACFTAFFWRCFTLPGWRLCILTHPVYSHRWRRDGAARMTSGL